MAEQSARELSPYRVGAIARLIGIPRVGFLDKTGTGEASNLVQLRSWRGAHGNRSQSWRRHFASSRSL